MTRFHTLRMSISQHPLWSKFFAGLLAVAVTGTLAFALDTRDAVRDHEARIQNVEEATAVLPKLATDVAVLRDRSDREYEAK